jgi:hypothetical protein
VAFDPLDGSSNIDCNVSTGTIFAVWEKVTFLQELNLCCLMLTLTPSIDQRGSSHRERYSEERFGGEDILQELQAAFYIS